ncbi:hypothetical protein ACQKPX_11500 [Photobacterium sp. DNB23_23_1]|uniref:Uncharacterized protein n=1 Tax=Photobacterium pectinilyticum TaxID=2906793 RepID=A0ABT1MWI0_9GAMM|nr:hypothetical protein [Photobacterium sp. ZSDE20]MCQ1056836.1 hypothetical protein [Photobacterium sp. ZSDE20]MDD1820970.1 hypothetical protein [Photobacterium sp. ZSDE20]
MDQADKLRSIFAKQSAKEQLIQCINKLREAIKTGSHEDIHFLMEELEQAQSYFEENLVNEDVNDQL